jgi:hypothetical protein
VYVGLDVNTVATVWVCAYRTPKYHFEVPGELLNTNTIESFHALDKKKQLDLVAAKVPSASFQPSFTAAAAAAAAA